MKGLPVGECRNCGVGLSYLAPRCLHCGAPNLPNPVATVVALVAVMLLGGVVAGGVLAWRSPGATGSATRTAPQGAPGGTPADPAGKGSGDYGWLVNAMAECEAEAKVKVDTMHFLIVPVTTTKTSILGWTPTPITTVGERATLLNSTDTLLGLRNGVLALYTKPVAFAVSDPATQAVYKWRPTIGVAALKSRQTGAGSLTLGLELPGLGKDVEWGPTINLHQGCYWINALIRTGNG
jgi:hypothetical protein